MGVRTCRLAGLQLETCRHARAAAASQRWPLGGGSSARRRKLRRGQASIKASLDAKYFSAAQYEKVRLTLVARLRVAHEMMPSEASPS